MTNDSVVLADADGRPCGTADREGVHGPDTPLHFAFSCHLVVDGRILMTRRALSKRSWPGVWTNSFCGHPRPGEDVVDAVAGSAIALIGLAGALLIRHAGQRPHAAPRTAPALPVSAREPS